MRRNSWILGFRNVSPQFEPRWFLQELQMVMMVAVLKNSLDLTLHTFGHRAQEKCWNLQGSECSKWLETSVEPKCWSINQFLPSSL